MADLNMLTAVMAEKGISLVTRDTKQLERDTLDMQFEKLMSKHQATRDTGVAYTDEDVAAAIDKFYSKGNIKD